MLFGAKVATVDEAAIIAADPNNWLAHGRTYDEQATCLLAQPPPTTWASWVWPGTGIREPPED